MRRLGIFILLILVTGCSKTAEPIKVDPEAKYIITGVFDPAASAYVLKPGTATLKGEISAQGRDGLYRKGDGATVRLIPTTAYADEYISRLFQGKQTYRWAAVVYHLDPRFLKAMRYTFADKQGRYTFFGVPSGSYYVYATAPNPEHYFAIYDRVKISNGQSAELILKENDTTFLRAQTLRH